MNTRSITLDVLFREMPPEDILDLIKSRENLDNPDLFYQLFKTAVPGFLDNYTLDEQERISRYTYEAAAAMQDNGKATSPEAALFSVVRYAEDVLRELGGEPRCRVDKAFDWRDAFLYLGQDLFTCAYLANEDVKHNVGRDLFSWPAVIDSDCVTLNRILGKGIAENHQHLKGSSHTFALDWMALMNDPGLHSLLGEYAVRLNPIRVTAGNRGRIFTLKDTVVLACKCRSYLFGWLHNYMQSGSDEGGDNCCGFAEYEDDRNRDRNYKQDIVVFREQYGVSIPCMKGGFACLDYALEDRVFSMDPDAPYRSLAGERYFLYQCFEKILRREIPQEHIWVFYLYLILKNRFRSELIQVNGTVGFLNFMYYQDRKTNFIWNSDAYMGELYRMAINGPLELGYVCSLETRIAPEKSIEDNISTVRKTDQYKRYADISDSDVRAHHLEKLQFDENNYMEDDKFFYVVHFIKFEDKSLLKNVFACRHKQYRDKYRKQAMDIAKALMRSQYYAQRVRGIDAANREVVCPPEVFAVVFRFLRDFQTLEGAYAGDVGFSHRISVTYHVGEDFLDIIGALRDMDQAIDFFEMGRGDRFGHALGLGVDPKEHYAVKGCKVYMTKQRRLDDIVWMLYRGEELGMKWQDDLRHRLNTEAHNLFNEIYGKVINEHKWYMDLTEYYQSMKLRGDEPSLYQDMEYKEKPYIDSEIDRYAVRNNDECKRLRQDPRIVGIYYSYHYDRDCKKTGEETVKVEIDNDYIEQVKRMQNLMMAYIASKGIAIECNPSSNVLIGSFGEYIKHPIFRFYPPEGSRSADRNELLVCINTDDLGVFDTSQSFEYVLLYQALSEAVDKDGNKLYRERDILAYLEAVRDMGCTLIFPKVNARKAWTNP